MRRIVFAKAALKALRRLDPVTTRRIRAAIDAYAADPTHFTGDVKALRGGEGLVRVRVGGWRILLSDDGIVVAVEMIGVRGSVYRSLNR